MPPSTDSRLGSRLTQSLGEPRWSLDVEAAVKSSPTVVDGTVYVGSEDGFLHAVSTDGTEQWDFDTGDAVFAAPTVVDGTVFVGSRHGPGADLYALDADSGDELWSVEHYAWHVTASPGFHDGTILVGTNDGMLYGLAADTGDEEWSRELPAPMGTNPCVVDGTAYFGRPDSTLQAVDVASGDDHWTTSVGTVPTAPTVLEEGGPSDGATLFVGEGRAFEDDVSPKLSAIDAESGEEVWSDDETEYISAAPTVLDGSVYAAYNVPLEDDLRALSVSDGRQESSFDPLGMISVPPTVAGGVAYLGTLSGHIVAVDTTDWSEQWRFEIGEPIESAPIVVEGTLYVGSDDGKLYAFETGHDESSQDSLVRHATFGHHETAFADASVSASSGGGSGDVDDASGAGESDDDGSDSLPGPGILGTITSMVGAGYLLKRGAEEDPDE